MSNDVLDRAFSGHSPYGLINENTFAGATSFLRRPYSKEIGDADVELEPLFSGESLCEQPA